MIGFMTFCFALHSIDLTRKEVKITNDLVDLFTVPPKYHEFIDIFSKAKVETLVLHHFYNLQIKLENEEKLLIRTIYLLSAAEQEVLKEFIYENFNT